MDEKMILRCVLVTAVFQIGATGTLAKCDPKVLCNAAWWTTAEAEDVQGEIVDLGFINSRDWKGFTPLHYAAAYGDPNLMAVLLQAGANANDRDNTMAQTPLHWAAHTGTSEAILLLIAAGADLVSKDAIDRPPAYFALRNEKLINTAGFAAIVNGSKN